VRTFPSSTGEEGWPMRKARRQKINALINGLHINGKLRQAKSAGHFIEKVKVR